MLLFCLFNVMTVTNGQCKPNNLSAYLFVGRMQLIYLLNSLRTNQTRALCMVFARNQTLWLYMAFPSSSRLVRQDVTADAVGDRDAATAPRPAADCMVPARVAHAQTRCAQLRNTSPKFVHTIYSTYTGDGDVRKLFISHQSPFKIIPNFKPMYLSTHLSFITNSTERSHS
jgi:hypothetical protein